MADERDRRWGDYVTTIPVERILEAMPDAMPRTTEEIATAIGVLERTARNRLEDLRDDGRVDTRSISVGTESVELWWIHANEHVRRATATPPGDPPAEDDVEVALAALDLPGASDLMREWRRDAVRAAFWHLAEYGPMDGESIRDGVFASHHAGYDDPDAWWGMIEPRLRDLPDVSPPRWPDQPWTMRHHEEADSVEA